jgi:hypothetical protein
MNLIESKELGNYLNQLDTEDLFTCDLVDHYCEKDDIALALVNTGIEIGLKYAKLKRTNREIKLYYYSDGCEVYYMFGTSENHAMLRIAKNLANKKHQEA